MKLSVNDRLWLLNFVPRGVGLISGQLWRGIIKEVEFSTEEIAELELKDQPGGGFSWNSDKAKEKEVRFSKEQIQEICLVIDEMDKNKNIPFAALDLVLRIKE